MSASMPALQGPVFPKHSTQLNGKISVMLIEYSDNVLLHNHGLTLALLDQQIQLMRSQTLLRRWIFTCRMLLQPACHLQTHFKGLIKASCARQLVHLYCERYFYVSVAFKQGTFHHFAFQLLRLLPTFSNCVHGTLELLRQQEMRKFFNLFFSSSGFGPGRKT